jgi:soluble lytic murein transglycosylase-like protein
MKAALIAMILQIAPQYDVPPYFMVAIAEVESEWNVNAVHVNSNGTKDLGLMQLNSSWFAHSQWNDPEVNIRHAAVHIDALRNRGLTWWQVAVAYNCGIGRLKNPPARSVDYAAQIFTAWGQYDRAFNTHIGR